MPSQQKVEQMRLTLVSTSWGKVSGTWISDREAVNTAVFRGLAEEWS